MLARKEEFASKLYKLTFPKDIQPEKKLIMQAEIWGENPRCVVPLNKYHLNLKKKTMELSKKIILQKQDNLLNT